LNNNDSCDLEVYAIVKKSNGNYAAFEIKLGLSYIDEASDNLKKFIKNIYNTEIDFPK